MGGTEDIGGHWGDNGGRHWGDNVGGSPCDDHMTHTAPPTPPPPHLHGLHSSTVTIVTTGGVPIATGGVPDTTGGVPDATGGVLDVRGGVSIPAPPPPAGGHRGLQGGGAAAQRGHRLPHSHRVPTARGRPQGQQLPAHLGGAHVAPQRPHSRPISPLMAP